MIKILKLSELVKLSKVLVDHPSFNEDRGP